MITKVLLVLASGSSTLPLLFTALVVDQHFLITVVPPVPPLSFPWFQLPTVNSNPKLLSGKFQE